MKDADDVKLVKEVFREVFELVEPECYGGRKRAAGVHNGTEGVQWNAGILESGDAYLGVNLEGKEYDGWPIARLINRELEDLKLFEALKLVQKLDEIELVFWCDAWGPGGSRRTDFKEHVIAPTPITLNRLTEELWQQVLEEARGCLDETRNFHGRARRLITVVKDEHEERIEYGVSPHIQFRVRLWRQAPPTFAEACRRMSEARTLLQPLHDWATITSAR